MSGYIIIAAVLFVDGLLFNAFALAGADEALVRGARPLLLLLQRHCTMIAAVFISMRLLAEERQTGHLVLLYSSPVRDGEIVLGKYPLGAGLPGHLPARHRLHAGADHGQRQDLARPHRRRLPGLLLLGSATLAIGTFGSALARSQVLAAILSGVHDGGAVIVLAAGAGHRAAALGDLRGAGAATACTSSRSSGHRPPPRRRLLPGGHLRRRCSPRPGCSRRGDGDEP